MAENRWHGCKLSKKGKPSIYSLKYERETEVNREMKIRKCEIGSPGGRYRGEKVVMFVGETGSGKTSTINNVVNFLLGVQWEKDERYQLLLDEDETKGKAQTMSQTTWITSYTFHQTKRTDYKVTLVDTPGYGHTGGKEFDDFITKQVREFFSTEGEGGIDHIDAVAFVVNGSINRFTETQKYIYDSVFDLFGEDIGDNIFFFITHVESTRMVSKEEEDEEEEQEEQKEEEEEGEEVEEEEEEEEDLPVMEALKLSHIMPKGYCLCNNKVLFHPKLKKKKGEDVNEINKNVFKGNEKSFRTFLADLDGCHPQSLVLTQDVLKEREELEIMVKGIHELITRLLIEIGNLSKQSLVLDGYATKLNVNLNFSFETEQVIVEEIILKEGERATVCNACQITCHYPCKRDVFMKVGGVKMCAAMKSSKCLVCKCLTETHETGSKKYEQKWKSVIEVDPDKKEKHSTAKQNIDRQETVLCGIKEMQIKLQDEIDADVERLQRGLERLSKISLKPNPRLILQELKDLEDRETSEQKPQWQDRVTELRRIYKKVEKVVEDKSAQEMNQ